MNKTDFTLELSKKLPNISKEEIDERLSFYLEMIDDRMEDGLSEANSGPGIPYFLSSFLIVGMPE